MTEFDRPVIHEQGNYQMREFEMRILLSVLLTFMFSAHANAQVFVQTWQTLSDDSLGSLFVDNLPGPDGLSGTPDDVSVPGRNSMGHSATAVIVAPDLAFSVWGGTLTQTFDSSTGATNILTQDIAGTFHCDTLIPGCGVTFFDGSAFSGTQGVGKQSGAPSGLQTWDYVVHTLMSDGTNYQRTGTSYVLLPGQNPYELFGMDIGDHFSMIMTSTVLPADSIVGYFAETFVGVDGPFIGVGGFQYGTMYLTDQVAVPIPSAFPLLLGGLGILVARRRPKTA